MNEGLVNSVSLSGLKPPCWYSFVPLMFVFLTCLHVVEPLKTPDVTSVECLQTPWVRGIPGMSSKRETGGCSG